MVQPVQGKSSFTSEPSLRYGILGGSFDPIHLGHLVAAQEVLISFNLDKLFFIPTGSPPHKAKTLTAEPKQRLEMAQLAIEDNPRFDTLSLEVERTGPSYTADTLDQLNGIWGRHVAKYLILGWDAMEYFTTWHLPEKIVLLSDSLVVMHRAGYSIQRKTLGDIAVALPGLEEKIHLLEVPQLEISSTGIRQRIAQHKSIKYLVPQRVEDYIYTHNLYKPKQI